MGLSFLSRSSAPRTIDQICYDFNRQVSLDNKVRTRNLEKFVRRVNNTPHSNRTISVENFGFLSKDLRGVNEIFSRQGGDLKSAKYKTLSETLLLVKKPKQSEVLAKDKAILDQVQRGAADLKEKAGLLGTAIENIEKDCLTIIKDLEPEYEEKALRYLNDAHLFSWQDHFIGKTTYSIFATDSEETEDLASAHDGGSQVKLWSWVSLGPKLHLKFQKENELSELKELMAIADNMIKRKVGVLSVPDFTPDEYKVYDHGQQ